MEHEDYIKKRDDVLNWKDRAYEEWHKTSKGLDWSDSQHVQEVATEIRERHEREAAQAIDALVLEVIGKDWDGTKHPENGGYNASKNEQRHIVEGK